METMKAISTERRIIRNSMRTPDGTHLISRFRHDYITHLDENGEEYMVDGGNEYIRRSLNAFAAKDTTLYSDEPHEVLRVGVSWGRRDEDNELDYIPINRMSKAHMKAVIEDGYSGAIVDLMKDELVWREENESESEAKRMELQREAGYG